MSKELLIIALSIIFCGFISVIIPSIIKGLKDLKTPLTLSSKLVYDKSSLNSYLRDDRKALCNQISTIKLLWNDCKDLLIETENDLYSVYNSMKSGVSVEDSEEVSETYEYLREQKRVIEEKCRQYKYDYRHLNHILSVIDAVV